MDAAAPSETDEQGETLAPTPPAWWQSAGAMLALLLIMMLLAWLLPKAWLDGMMAWLQDLHGFWAAAIFLACSLPLMAGGFPGTIVTVSTGFIFGAAVGIPLALVAVFGSGCATYAVARLFPPPRRPWARLQRWRRLLHGGDWRLVVILRLVPMLPYCLINYALGRSRVPWRAYVIGTALGILPGTAVSVYVGSLGRDLWAPDRHTEPVEWVVVAGGMLVLAVTPWFLRRRLRRMAQLEAASGSADHDGHRPPLDTHGFSSSAGPNQ